MGKGCCGKRKQPQREDEGTSPRNNTTTDNDKSAALENAVQENIELEEDDRGTSFERDSIAKVEETTLTSAPKSEEEQKQLEQFQHIESVRPLFTSSRDNRASIVAKKTALLNEIRLVMATTELCKDRLKKTNELLNTWPSTLNEVQQLADNSRKQTKLKDIYLKTTLARERYMHVWFTSVSSTKAALALASEGYALCRANAEDLKQAKKDLFAGISRRDAPDEQYWVEGLERFFVANDKIITIFHQNLGDILKLLQDDRFNVDFTDSILVSINNLVAALDSADTVPFDAEGSAIQSQLSATAKSITELIELLSSISSTLESAVEEFEELSRAADGDIQNSETGLFNSISRRSLSDSTRYFIVGERKLQEHIQEFQWFGATCISNQDKQIELWKNAQSDLASCEKYWDDLSLSDDVKKALRQAKASLEEHALSKSPALQSALSRMISIEELVFNTRFSFLDPSKNLTILMLDIESVLKENKALKSTKKYLKEQKELSATIDSVRGLLETAVQSFEQLPAELLSESSPQLTKKSQDVLASVFGAWQSLSFADMYTPSSTGSQKSFRSHALNALDMLDQCLASAKENHKEQTRTVDLSRNEGESLGIHLKADDGTKGVRVLSCTKKSGARQTKHIHPNDAMLSVNGIDVSNLEHQQVINLITGTKGSITFEFARNFTGRREVSLPSSNVLGFGIMFVPEDKRIKVVRVIPASPADNCNQIFAGQIIEEVNGNDTLGMSKNDVVGHMRSSPTVMLVVNEKQGAAKAEEVEATPKSSDENIEEMAGPANVLTKAAESIPPPSSPAPNGPRRVSFKKSDGVIGINLKPRQSGPGVYVTGFKEGCQAEKSGQVHEGDFLIEIDGKDVSNLPSKSIYNIFGNETGEEIELVFDKEDPLKQVAEQEMEAVSDEKSEDFACFHKELKTITVVRTEPALGLRLSAMANKLGMRILGITEGSLASKYSFSPGFCVHSINGTVVCNLPHNEAVGVIKSTPGDLVFELFDIGAPPVDTVHLVHIKRTEDSLGLVMETSTEPPFVKIVGVKKDGSAAKNKDIFPVEEILGVNSKSVVGMAPEGVLEMLADGTDPLVLRLKFLGKVGERTIIINPEEGRSLGLNLSSVQDGKTIVITDTEENSPASNADGEYFDTSRIVTVNGDSVEGKDFVDVVEMIKSTEVNEPIVLTIDPYDDRLSRSFRRSLMKDIALPEAVPEPEPETEARATTATITTTSTEPSVKRRTVVINREEGKPLGLKIAQPPTGGVIIVGTNEGSAAANAEGRFYKKSVIVSVNGESAENKDTQEVVAMLGNAGDHIELVVEKYRKPKSEKVSTPHQVSTSTTTASSSRRTIVLRRVSGQPLGLKISSPSKGDVVIIGTKENSPAATPVSGEYFKQSKIVTVNGEPTEPSDVPSVSKLIGQSADDTVAIEVEEYVVPNIVTVVLKREAGVPLGIQLGSSSNGEPAIVYGVVDGSPASHPFQGMFFSPSKIRSVGGVFTQGKSHEEVIDMIGAVEGDLVEMTVEKFVEPTKARVKLQRQGNESFGLSIGSPGENCVVVYGVMKGSAAEFPVSGKFFPRSKIMSVNGESVENLPLNAVFEKVKAANDTLELEIEDFVDVVSLTHNYPGFNNFRCVMLRQQNSKPLGARLSVHRGQNVKVHSFIDGSVADAEKRIQVGDVILEVNGTKVGYEKSVIVDALGQSPDVHFLIGEPIEKDFTEDVSFTKNPGERVGMCLSSMKNSSGVHVTAVYSDGCASRTPIRPTDKLLEVNGEELDQQNDNDVTKMMSPAGEYSIRVRHQPVHIVKLSRNENEPFGINIVTFKGFPGAYVSGCRDGSPSQKCGLIQRGDFISKINNEDVSRLSRNEIIQKIGTFEEMEVELYKGSAATREYVSTLESGRSVQVRDAASPDEMVEFKNNQQHTSFSHQPVESFRVVKTVSFERHPEKKLGLKLRAIGSGTRGAVVEGVDPNGELGSKGICKGDRLLTVNNKDVSSVPYEDIVKAFQPSGPSQLTLDGCKKRDVANDLVILHRSDSTQSYGIRLKPKGSRTVIDDIVPDSIACHSKLQINDEVVSINSNLIAGVSHVQVLALLNQNTVYIEVDSREPDKMRSLQRTKSFARQTHRYDASNLRRVHLTKEEDEVFGLVLGVSNSRHGVVLAGIDEIGVAHNNPNLKVGDAVLAINNQSMLHATSDGSRAAISNEYDSLDLVVADAFPKMELVPVHFKRDSLEERWGCSICSEAGKPGTFVGHIFENSPSYRSGLRLDDQFSTVDGVDVVDLPHQQLLTMIASKVDTQVMVLRPSVVNSKRDQSGEISSDGKETTFPAVMDILASNPSVQPETVLNRASFVKTVGSPVGVTIGVTDFGPVVEGIEPDSQAEMSHDIHEGDTILAINGVDTTSVSDDSEVVTLFADQSAVTFLTSTAPPLFNRAPSSGQSTLGQVRVFRMIRGVQPLGISTRTRTDDNLTVITAVEEDSIADETGVCVGDVVLAINGKQLEMMPQSAVREQLGAPEVTLVAGRNIVRKTTLTNNPLEGGHGVALEGVEDISGNGLVAISRVDEESPAERSGEVFVGDVILGVNGQSCVGKKPEDIQKTMDESDQIDLILAPGLASVADSYHGDIVGAYGGTGIPFDIDDVDDDLSDEDADDEGEDDLDLSVVGNSLSATQLKHEMQMAKEEEAREAGMLVDGEMGEPVTRGSLVGLQEDAIQAREEKEAIEQELTALKQDMETSESLRVRAEDELVTLKQHILQLEKEKSEAEEHKAQAETQLQEAQAKVSLVEGSLSDEHVPKAIHNAQQQELADLKAQLETATAQSSAADSELSSIKEQLENTDSEMADAKKALIEKEAELAKQQEELSDLSSLKEAADEEMKALNEEVKGLKEQLEIAEKAAEDHKALALANDDARVQAVVEKNEKKMQVLEEKKKALEESLALAQKQQETFEKEADERVANAQKLADEEISSAKKAAEGLEGKLKSMQAEKDEEKTQLEEKLEKTLSDLSTKEQEMESLVEEKNSLIDELQSQLQMANEELLKTRKPKKGKKSRGSGSRAETPLTNLLPEEERYHPHTDDLIDVGVSVDATSCMVGKEDVERVGRGKYKFFGEDKVISVRTVGKVTMVRVGGGWQNLKEYLKEHKIKADQHLKTKEIKKFNC
eukprot:m.171663 g.171663  ORF g.171663 m.171663 type:complete len:3135 (-) comp13499_c1_seq14:1131-10535(-)